MKITARESTAMPPTTPPAIAPTGVGLVSILDVGVVEAVLDVGVVEVVLDVDVVLTGDTRK